MRQERPFERSAGSWTDLLAILFLLISIISFWTSWNENFSFATNSFFQGFLLFGLVAFFLKIRGGNWWELGLMEIPSRKGLAFALAGGLGMAWLMAEITRLIELLPWQVPQQAAVIEISRAGSWREFLPVLVSVAVIAPVSEEVFFRGYCFPLFRVTWGPRRGSLLSALFFGAMHFDVWRLLPLAVAGWILNLLYEKTGSLWTPIVAHAIWNAALALQLFGGLF